jgi:hypothetical protein
MKLKDIEILNEKALVNVLTFDGDGNMFLITSWVSVEAFEVEMRTYKKDFEVLNIHIGKKEITIFVKTVKEVNKNE